MLNSPSDDDTATVVLAKTIMQVLVLHYRSGPMDGKLTQALDALATAVGVTIAGSNESQKARVYFHQRLSASLAQALLEGR